MTQKFLAVILSAGAIFGMYTQHQQIQKQSKVIEQSQQKVQDKEIQIEQLNSNIGELERELQAVHNDLEYTNNELQKQKEVSRGNGRKINVELTHYTHTGNPTASGKMPQAGRTIAHSTLPLGTEVMIDNHLYIVEDRCPSDGVIDIFVDSEEEAIKKGRIYTTVEVL